MQAEKKRLPTPCGTTHQSEFVSDTNCPQALESLPPMVVDDRCRRRGKPSTCFFDLQLSCKCLRLMGEKKLLWELSHLDWTFCRCTLQRHSSASGPTCASPLAPPPPPPPAPPAAAPPVAPAPAPLIGCSQVRWLRTHHSSAEASGSLWLPGKNIQMEKVHVTSRKLFVDQICLFVFWIDKGKRYSQVVRHFRKRMIWGGHHGDLVIMPSDYLLQNGLFRLFNKLSS